MYHQLLTQQMLDKCVDWVNVGALLMLPHFDTGEGNGTPLQYSCLENPWGRKESDMTERLHFIFHFDALEKEMATHSSVLTWRIPGMGEPGGLPSMESHRVGHD